MDDEEQHVFVYNQIFFSFAVGEADNAKDAATSDLNPTYTTTNHDLLGLRALQVIDIDGLHIIATCHVNYKGARVIAQSIIPGILTNTDQTSLTEYGSVDNGNTIHNNDEFNDLMKKLCQHLSIKECSVVDKDGNVHQIAGSIDIKGIRGTDKRKYLLDLVRLTPRDSNYLGKKHTNCLVRPELVRIFQKTRDIEYASNKLAEFEKSEPEETKAVQEDAKSYFDMNEEEKKQAVEKSRKEIEDKKAKQIKRLQMFDQYLKEAPQFKYNLNIHTDVKLAEGDYKDDEKTIRNLGDFISNTVIPKLIQNFESGENVPTDNVNLAEILHSQGLNMRYIGKISKSIEEGKLPHIKSLLERCMVCRCAANVFNDLVKGVPSSGVSKFIAHFCNILLAPEHIIQKLNDGEVLTNDSSEETKSAPKPKVIEQPSSEPQNSKQSTKKKNKNKKKSKTPGAGGSDGSKADKQIVYKINSLFNKNFKTLIEDNKNTKLSKLKPKELYSKIVRLVKKKYDYDLAAELVDLKCRKTYKNKIALLRDLCLSIGVKIHAKAYNLDEAVAITDDAKDAGKTAHAQLNNKLPFCDTDIVEIVPRIRHIEIVNYDYKSLVSSAKASLKEGYFEQAFDYLNQAININLQIAGPINKETAGCLSKLSDIHYKFGDYGQAIQLQMKCVILNEKIFGKVHPQTAKSYASLAQINFQNTLNMGNDRIQALIDNDFAKTNGALDRSKQIKEFSRAFEYMNRALYIYEIVCGSNHPEISSIYMKLGSMYNQIDDIQMAIDCFKQSLYRNISMYGENHIQVANCYQIIANAYQNLEHFRKALEFQELSHNILTKLYKADDIIVMNSLATIDQLTKLSVQKEYSKIAEQRTQRQFENNKNKSKVNKQRENPHLGQYMNLAQIFNANRHPVYRNLQYLYSQHNKEQK